MYDAVKNRCENYSGSGAEGNYNSTAFKSTWAQPSGITRGNWNGSDYYYVADSESSAIRAIACSNAEAKPVVGAN